MLKRWVREHWSGITADVIAGLLVAAITGVVGWAVWASLNSPVSNDPTRKTDVLPLAPFGCESIDRSGKEVLGQSIFSVGQHVRDMFEDNTEGANAILRGYYIGLKVIECGYINSVSVSPNEFAYATFVEQPDDRTFQVGCRFDRSWTKKLATYPSRQRVRFQGIIFGPGYPDEVLLDRCELE